MKITIVRHGETIENYTNVVQGQKHGKLSKLGEKQAEKVVEYLKKEKFDFIYSSDLRRCKQTIKPLLKYISKKVEYSKLLREQSKGVFEGKPRKLLKKWLEKNPGKTPRGAESWNDVGNRVNIFLKNNIRKWENKNILLMIHGGTKQVLLNILFRGDEKNKIRINKKYSPNTGISIVELDTNGKFKLKKLRSIKHLKGVK
jgi:broad specificity phosphatase PhoE